MSASSTTTTGSWLFGAASIVGMALHLASQYTRNVRRTAAKHKADMAAMVAAHEDPPGMRMMVDMLDLFTRFGTAESAEQGLKIKLRKDDVFLVTYPKAGTSWLQQICHQLVTGGDTEFDEISCGDACPWLQYALDLGVDVAAMPTTKRRVFKSHDDVQTLRRIDGLERAKIIVVLRDGKTTAQSFYHFLNGWMFQDAEQKHFRAFFDFFFMGGTKSGRWFEHVRDWWQLRHEPNVLVLKYERLRADPRTEIARIAAFLDIDVTVPSPRPAGMPVDDGAASKGRAASGGNTLLDTVCYLSSFEWMSTHPRQFDEHFLRDTMDKLMGLSDDVCARSIVKLRAGQAGKSSKLWTTGCDAVFDAEFARVYGPLGVACYDDLVVEDAY